MDKQEIKEKYKAIIKESIFKLFGVVPSFQDDCDMFFIDKQEISLDFIENSRFDEFTLIYKEIKSIFLDGNNEYPFFLSVNLKDKDWSKQNDDNFHLYCKVSDFGNKEILSLFNAFESELVEAENKNHDNKQLVDLIPQAIKSNLLMEVNNELVSWNSNSLGDKKKWRSKVILGNSVGENKPDVGEYDEVRYIRIGIKTFTIVPIPIGDEHHCGGDYVEEMISQGLIPDDIYVAIDSQTNYIWNDDDLKELNYLKLAIKTWLKFGGNNAVLYFTRKEIKISFRDFIKLSEAMSVDEISSFMVVFAEKKILPIGKSIIKKFGLLANEFKKMHLNQRYKENIIYNKAEELQIISEEMFRMNSHIRTSLATLSEAINSLNLQKIEEALFSHNGLKNVIHILLKDAVSNSTDNFMFNLKYGELKNTFGNIDLALSEFDAISRI